MIFAAGVPEVDLDRFFRGNERNFRRLKYDRLLLRINRGGRELNLEPGGRF